MRNNVCSFITLHCRVLSQVPPSLLGSTYVVSDVVLPQELDEGGEQLGQVRENLSVLGAYIRVSRCAAVHPCNMHEEQPHAVQAHHVVRDIVHVPLAHVRKENAVVF